MNCEQVSPFLGKWKLVESKNFQEYLKATGAPAVICKLFKNTKPTIEICVSDDQQWIIFHTKFALKNISTKSRIDGQEHAADLPAMSSSKKAKNSRSNLTFDSDSKTMTVDVWSSGGNSKNRSRRWIVDEDDGGNKLGKPKLFLELTLQKGDDFEEGEMTSADENSTALRIFEKIDKEK